MLNRLKKILLAVGPAKFFIIIATFFGFSIILITPPFQGPDEIVHFYRSYQISEGKLTVDQINRRVVGGHLPSSLGQTVSLTHASELSFHPQNKYREGFTKRALSIKLNTTKRSVYDFATTTSYPPTAYLPSSIAISIGRIFSAPPIILLYMGRVADLTFFILLMSLAIKYMPRQKWVFTAIALLPMTIFEAATLNTDALTICSLGLFLALILKFRENSSITPLQLSLLLLVGTFMALSKSDMFIFLPLVLLVKSKNLFANFQRANFVKVLLIILPFILVAIWTLHTQSINISGSYYNHQNPKAQLSYVVHNPLDYVNVLWNTYFYTWGDTITRSFIGDFGWVDTPLSEFIVTLGYIGLAFLIFSISDTQNTFKSWFNRKEKLLLGGIALTYFVAISTVLYLYYSPVGFKIIVGLQGRYFIPLALILVPLGYNKAVRVGEKLYKQTAIGLPLFLLTSGIITLYVRYFIHNV